jgi:hypothetical protein
MKQESKRIVRISRQHPKRKVKKGWKDRVNIGLITYTVGGSR